MTTKRYFLAGLLLAAALAALPITDAAAVTRVIQPTPNPAGSTGSALTGVSCPTSTDCTAVGAYQPSGGHDQMLAEQWSGSTWTIQTTPLPPGGIQAYFQAVSCTAPTTCIAVGWFSYPVGSLVPLAERWNGSAWTPVLPQVPGATTFSFLSGVSCTSTTNCIAVGMEGPSSGGYQPLIERWDGAGWTIQTASKLAGWDVSLNGLSCTSTTTCLAVGVMALGSASRPAAERWNGQSWDFEIPYLPNDAKSPVSGQLNSVSCASASNCQAVGTYVNTSNVTETLANISTGPLSWAAEPTSSPGRTHSILNGVACPSASSCTAVGYWDTFIGTDVTLGEFWGGGSWAFGSTPTIPYEPTLLNAVSCSSTSVCMAVGQFRGSTGFVTLAERYT